MHSTPSRRLWFSWFLLPYCAFAAAAPAVSSGSRLLADSIRTVATAPSVAGRTPRAYVSRPALTAAELAAPMKFEVALAMRNFAELEARLANREIISPAELRARYLPLAPDYTRVRQWLESEGFEITRTDAHHLALFARGPVSEVSRALHTTFARVASSDGEFTSAISPPVVPEGIAPLLRGLHGLQPHVRLHPRAIVRPASLTNTSPPFTPAQISHAYQADTLNLTGAGQTIAIYSLGNPNNSDLTLFWSKTQSTATLGNVEIVPVAGGPQQTDSGIIQEANLDVEWASTLAPGAKIRVYAADSNDPVADDELIQEILGDLSTHPTIHQLTISYGYNEDGVDRDYLGIEAQYMAALVGSGVTVFAASGDSSAQTASALGVSVPADMPDVTAVGGTSLTLNSTGAIASESAWGNLFSAGGDGSGGGISTVYARPSWQSGAGFPAGAFRLVPDVAAAADPSTGAYFVYNGKDTSAIGGTSWSSPTWAAFCAMINQSRAAAGKGPLGALNPRLYALAGTAAFNDVTSGGNSVYRAGVGYDMVTGLGSPRVASLLAAMATDTFAPVIEFDGGNRATTAGLPCTLYVVATGAPTPSFKWQRLPAGASTWADISDATAYSGATTYALMVNSATLAMTGDQFRCVISNSIGSVASAPATLTVTNFGVGTVAGWPGWSGYADGRGSNGRFNFTGSVRTDDHGVIYVADASNNTIRKIDADGTVSTFAGAAGQAGAVDGPALSARFNGPAGVAIDHAGNIYIADSLNFTIRKISPDGTVSTLAGKTGFAHVVDGTGTEAEFRDPQNLAVDSAGNIYVADGQGNCVRKVTPLGVVTTLAGSATAGSADGTGASASFHLLAGITVDAAGTVYVSDTLNDTVRKISPAGVVTTLAGQAGISGSADGTGAKARFWAPAGLAVDAAGNLFVADSLNNAIRTVTPNGVVATLAGSSSDPDNVDGAFATARFNQSADVAIAPDGLIYVADGPNCTIRRITLAPAIATGPAAQTIATGGNLSLTVVVTGTGPYSYQWYKDDVAIAGATAATYAVASAASSTAGSYTVAVTTPSGTLTSSAALVTVQCGQTPSTLTNLSVRTTAGTGDQTLIAGFAISGSVSKRVLIRGVGPTLTSFSVTGVAPDPALNVVDFKTGALVASNDNWASTDAAAMTALGAFPLGAGSKDAALFATLVPTTYSAKITDATSTGGIALAEIYDAAPGNGARLINLSARAQVGTGGGVLIAGFTIAGDTTKTLLIRGIGPALTGFGIAGALANPKLEIFPQTPGAPAIATNDDWDGSTTMQNTFNQAGAFGLPVGSKDAALIVTLPPGLYSAVVSGVNDTTGVGLVEIYDLQ